MQITQNELNNKYGINIPKGKYRIYTRDDKYDIYTVKDDTEGCILVGKNTATGIVLESTVTFTNLYNELKKYKIITIEIS